MEGEIEAFYNKLDGRLESYFNAHKRYVCCTVGCCACCEKGDYPLSRLELEYLMQGYIELVNSDKIIVQNNLKSMVKGGSCPFLINKKCSVYPYRPIVCRVHGLAYLCSPNKVKVPYCVNNGKNYNKVYDNGSIIINPVLENLDTPEVLKELDYGEIRNLYDWIKQ